MRLVLACLISVLPLNKLRCFFYNTLLGYQIKNSHVGFLAIININKFEITDSRLGKFNYFTGPMKVKIGKGVKIGFRNKFNCGKWVAKREGYKRELVVEQGVLITNGHHFDVAGKIQIGKDSVIAGISSQFWTHGNGVQDHDIAIGNNCYVGTSSIFCPGAQIADKTLVGAGTVITKVFEEQDVLIVGSQGQIKQR